MSKKDGLHIQRKNNLKKMSGFKVHLQRLGVFTFALMLIFSSLAFGQESDVRSLSPGQTIEREISGKETHHYKFELKKGEFSQVRVEQKGVDVALKLLDSDGKTLATMDSPNSEYGSETLSYISSKDESYNLEIGGSAEKTGKGIYTIKRETPRTATAKDKRRVEVEQMFVEGINARKNKGQSKLAIKKLEQALAGWQELKDVYLEAITLHSIGVVYKQSGENQKALEFYNTALPLLRAVEDKRREATTHNNIGKIYWSIGEQQKALEFYNQALLLRKGVGDLEGEASTLNDIGAVYSSLGEKQKAIEFSHQALPLFRAVGNGSGEAESLTNIGIVFLQLGETQKAFQFLHQALPLFRAVGDKRGEAYVLNSLGSVYERLGERQKALEFYNQALPLFRAVGDKRAEAFAFNLIGRVYYSLGEKQKAIEFSYQALPLHRAIGNRGGEAAILNNIAQLYSSLGEKQKALEFYNQALSLMRAVEDKRNEATTLHNIGHVYWSIGEQQKALEFYNQALPLKRAVGDRNGEAIILKNMMKVWDKLNNGRMAIFFGKQSVNKYQELRLAIQGLDKKTKKTYLGTIEETYKKLAEILIAEGRIIEAEQVLQMLKQEEVFDYLRRNRSEADKLSQRADLTKKEADALKRYNEISDEITSLGTEFGKLQELLSKSNELTEEQEKRYDKLSEQIGTASRRFQVFLRQLSEEFAKRPNTKKDFEENIGLQSDLKSWGKDIVSLTTLVGEDRYRILLFTPETQTDGKSEIKAVDLNKKIFEFRQVVQDPRSDPRPLGKELYDILIKPIEKDLEGAGAKTLLWSLDGNLRSLPLAALWDGEQYFGQKYQNVVITLASRTRLGEAVALNWRALGLGVSEAKVIKDPDGIGDFKSSALPAVPSELAAIVQNEKSPNGVLPGQSLLDAEFTEKGFKRELIKGYKVIHIASHFMLNPGDATKSFLLLGDGKALTVDEIKNNPQLKFNGVELLTLSACETAVTGKDSTGKEIEGFAYVAQQNGAKAILATLWAVADDSTQILMAEFYRLRKENPNMTKAEAMQIAQREMIEGKLKSTETTEQRNVRRQLTREKGQSKQKINENAPYAHPYYWAPFVLIGNWK